MDKWPNENTTGVFTVAVTSPEFWDRVAPSYAKQPIADSESYARKLASTQALMRPNMEVLEFGCGTGSTALEHAPHVAHIVATDVSAAMIDIGREKAKHAGVDNVSFRQSGVGEFEAPDSSYDMVAPGDATNSWLQIKLEGTQGGGNGSQMPIGGSALSSSDLSIVEDWIDDGAWR